jgi:hypothetical protein
LLHRVNMGEVPSHCSGVDVGCVCNDVGAVCWEGELREQACVDGQRVPKDVWK